MTGNFPPPAAPRTPVTRPSTNPDKPALKDACSDTESRWSVRVRRRGYGGECPRSVTVVAHAGGAVGSPSGV
ncbi:hypothetical protein GCM10010243_47670 [Streptomyces matensis]|nr:hypothetical protein GCM10010243_47670 [Streptomyces matensis]